MSEKQVALVVDNGSFTTKCGLSDSDKPTTVFRSVVGHSLDESSKAVVVGDEALSKQDALELAYPVECGIVTSADDMEKLWHYMFYGALRMDPEEHPLLLTEDPLNPKSQRESVATAMFETFHVPALLLGAQSVLSLHTTGLKNGVVVDIGDRVGHVVPVIDGKPSLLQIRRMEITGQQLTEFLAQQLVEHGQHIPETAAMMEVVRTIKEKFGKVALNFETEMQIAEGQNYQLPDGSSVTIGNESYQCPEILFQPSLVGMATDGIHSVTDAVIKSCKAELHEELYGNIILSGGTTMFPGFAERLQKEIAALAPASVKINIVAQPDRNYSAWKGGSILAASSSIKQMWISRKEYDEAGPTIVNRKCS